MVIANASLVKWYKIKYNYFNANFLRVEVVIEE